MLLEEQKACWQVVNFREVYSKEDAKDRVEHLASAAKSGSQDFHSDIGSDFCKQLTLLLEAIYDMPVPSV
jgi:hypothetical protein